MPGLYESLRGLQASDRTPEEQRAINNTMGYKDRENSVVDTLIKQNKPEKPVVRQATSPSDTIRNMVSYQNEYQRQLDNLYKQSLSEFEGQYGVSRNTSNGNAVDYINKIGNQFSSYYKKFNGTDKLPLDDQQYKKLAAEHQARKSIYGEDAANQWLDNTFKDIIGENQSWWEQAVNAFSSLIPTIEGGAVSTVGNIYGAINPILSLVDKGLDLPDNSDLNWWDNYINNIIDNPVTRLGNDITSAQASYIGQGITNLLGISDETASQRIQNMKTTATKYNPQGIGALPIVTTSDQDDSLISSATPWLALQSGGYTALSILEGVGLAKVGEGLFKLATNATKLVRTGRNLEKSLETIRKFQNYTEPLVIGGIVGSGEGALEGLQTKIQVESEGLDSLNSFYQDKVATEAKELYESDTLNPMMEVMTDKGKVMQRKYATPEDAYREVWDKYKDQYEESRRQIDWAASKAGIHNYWANSIINGMLNSTLKVGLAAPRVQETLRNSRLTSWVYRKPQFMVSDDVATPKISKLGVVKQVLKEPFGEGLEEYAQSLSSDVFSSAAENNINEFIQNKFNGDGNVKVSDTFASDWGAAEAALTNSVKSIESLQSAVLGAVSSTMGTIGGIGRGYHRDEEGNLVRNKSVFGKNLLRGYNSDGTKESLLDYASRVTPWRSGFVNAISDVRKEIADAKDTAAAITEWLKDPTNRDKWDGLVGTASWMTQMERASESNDQFNYRKAQIGKAINDVFILSKLEGTPYYDSVIKDLQRASEMEVSSDVAQQMIEKVRNSNKNEFQHKSDAEIIEKIQSNANKMLGLMSTIEKESNTLDRLFGRMDEDTKQSLIYGKTMEKDFTERRDRLEEEINDILNGIKSSRNGSGAVIDDTLKSVIMKYGSVNKAIRALGKLQDQKKEAKERVEELRKIDKSKRSDKQNKELLEKEKAIQSIDRQIQSFEGLYEKDDKGKSTGEIDASLLSMVLNEQEIMNLDPVTRAMVLAQGASKLYNAMHQDKQAVDKINREIDTLDRQIDNLETQRKKWHNTNGTIKKHHHKQVKKVDAEIANLQGQRNKKLRELDAVQGDRNSKPIYSEAQQQVIDNLIQQGQQRDVDFLDKVVDMGRLEKGIKDYHTQYQAILADPRAFQNYVLKAKYNAARDLTRRRAERIANIEDFQEYSQELDKLMANASQQEANDIVAVLREKDAQQKAEKRAELEQQRIDDWHSEEDGQLEQDAQGNVTLNVEEETALPESNFDRYKNNVKNQTDLVRQFAKNPNLTDNDQSLLINAIQYLQSKGVSVTDRENAVETLLEKDEKGNIGGKFRQWVEEKNNEIPVQQRTFMPVFTTIGQIVSDYVQILNGHIEDRINKGNVNPVVIESPQTTTNQGTAPTSSTDTDSSSQEKPKHPSLLDIGSSSPDSGHFVDDEGTVATDAQTKSVQDKEEQREDASETEIKKAFKNVVTPELFDLLTIVENTIENSSESTEVKELAKQYFMDIAVNGDEVYDTIDDLLVAIQGKLNELKQQSMNQEKKDNEYKKAHGILNKAYGLLHARSKRKRTMPESPTRTENPSASWIHTANIAFMEDKNPDAWPVRFTNDHAIDEWHRNHVIAQNEPIYFITNSAWTAEVTAQMNSTSSNSSQRKYDTLTDMPIVAAVMVEEPSNKITTTAIEINGQWYQPIGIMPSSKSRNSGAEHTFSMRKLASKEQGIHLITTNGLPLTSKVFGVNYRTAHHPDDKNVKRKNTQENNTDVTNAILDTLPNDEYARLTSMSRAEMLNDKAYRDARDKFLDAFSWDNKKNVPIYTPDRMRAGGTASPLFIYDKEMAVTKDRTTGQKTLESVLQNGNDDDLINFNSRISRLYDEVIRPAFSYYQPKDKYDKSAAIITQSAIDEAAKSATNKDAYANEAQRLTDFLNGRLKGSRGVADFVFMTDGWSFLVVSPESQRVAGEGITNSSTTYKVFLVNSNADIQPIALGEIRAGQQNTNDAVQLLKNFLYDSNTGKVRSFLKWQKPKQDALDVNSKDRASKERARKNYGAMVDDGILTFGGSSLVYDIDGIKIQSPINAQGKAITPKDKVSNPDNAQSAVPLNTTPQAEGATVSRTGQSVEPNSGIILSEDKPSQIPQKSEALKEAEKTVKKIIEDSKRFTLEKEGKYYYVIDKDTGERVKYLRVTTVIGADAHAPVWTPSMKAIVEKLKEKHTIPELSDSQLSSFKDIKTMSESLDIPIEDIRRAVAELRTLHKVDAYEAWSTPSTAIGNTADIITRDFLAGHVKDSYPNISKENLEKLIHQLTVFKSDLEANDIHIVSEGVVAHGKISVTAEDGTTHEVNVAGTLDLFGYDSKGNFYIFDMKTTRNHSKQKLEDEKAKWSRQISMYADLLSQTYGITIKPENLRIIPIDVGYPAPQGRGAGLDPTGPQYSTTDKGQLQMTYKDKEPKDFVTSEKDGTEIALRETTLKGQFTPGYTKFNVNWDFLSSEDQDIADTLESQVENGNDEDHKPQSATIETPKKDRPSFINLNFLNGDWSMQGTDVKAPPITPKGQSSVVPTWENLTKDAKAYLSESGWAENKIDYNDVINNPDNAEALKQDLKCRGLL